MLKKCLVCFKLVDTEGGLLEHAATHKTTIMSWPASLAAKLYEDLTECASDVIRLKLHAMGLLADTTAHFSIPTQDECKQKLAERRLKYRALLCNERGEIMVDTEYSMGIGHCPAYKQRVGWSGKVSVDDAKVIKEELDYGRHVVAPKPLQGMPILPDPVDVWYSIVSDSAADNTKFEDWCGDYGYNSDSISALKTFNVCCEFGKSLRLGLGMKTLEELRELFSDY